MLTPGKAFYESWTLLQSLSNSTAKPEHRNHRSLLLHHRTRRHQQETSLRNLCFSFSGHEEEEERSGAAFAPRRFRDLSSLLGAGSLGHVFSLLSQSFVTHDPWLLVTRLKPINASDRQTLSNAAGASYFLFLAIGSTVQKKLKRSGTYSVSSGPRPSAAFPAWMEHRVFTVRERVPLGLQFSRGKDFETGRPRPGRERGARFDFSTRDEITGILPLAENINKQINETRDQRVPVSAASRVTRRIFILSGGNLK